MSRQLIKNLAPCTLLITSAFASISAAADTYYVSNAQELQNALVYAYGNGRDTTDTIVINNEVRTTAEIQSFDIQSSVKITGLPGFRVSRIVRESTDKYLPLLNIQYKNVTVENLLLLGSGQNTNTQVAATAGDDTSNSALIYIPALTANGGPDNFKAHNNTFQESAVGIGSIGVIPKNITITANDFNYVNRSVELLRDVDRVSDVIWTNDATVLDGGKLNISGNWIRGNRIRLGISVDAGNDGSPYAAHGFPNPNSAIRVRFRDKPTVFDTSSTINRNNINGANEFGIAVATVRNMNVAGNIISTTEDDIYSAKSIEENFTAGINVEHNAYYINVENNTVTVGTIGPFATGINVLPFQDHGAPLDFRNTSNWVTIRGNTIKGHGRNAILAFGYSNLQVIENNASEFTTDSPYGVTASFYNIPNGSSNSTATWNTGLVFNGFSGTANRAAQSFDSSGNVY